MQTSEKINDKKSMLMLIASTLIFGTIGIFRRYIPFPSEVLACFRGLSGALFLFIVLKAKKGRFINHIGIKKTLGLIAAGAVMGINWMLLFEAYNYTGVGTATLCYYMQPTIVMLVSPFIFKEMLNRKKVFCILMSFVGMVLVSGVLSENFAGNQNAKGILFGLAAAMFYAGVVILNKIFGGVDAYEKTIIELLAAAGIMLPYILIRGVGEIASVDTKAVIMLIIVGIVHTGVAYALYFGSMDGLKTTTIAILSYIDPVSALLLSAVFLNERIGAVGIVGAILILGAAFLAEYKPQTRE